MREKFIIPIGTKFGKLKVIEDSHRVALKNGRTVLKFKCICDCGNVTNVTSGALRNKATVSCGCKSSEFMKSKKATHDMSFTKEYSAWKGIKRRCLNKNFKYYKLYGGRGIQMCQRWLNSFEDFYEDMGKSPSLLHSIDRINSNGNYEPSNCRWATKKEQSRNTSRNHLVSFNGKTQCISAWAEELGIKKRTILSRLECGKTIKQSLTI